MIEQIVILTLITFGICSTTWEDMILHKPAQWLESKLPVYITKPLFGCYICATFWWGGLSAYLLDWNVLLNIPAMGLSAVISFFND